jgi:hypothetical protein
VEVEVGEDDETVQLAMREPYEPDPLEVHWALSRLEAQLLGEPLRSFTLSRYVLLE